MAFGNQQEHDVFDYRYLSECAKAITQDTPYEASRSVYRFLTDRIDGRDATEDLGKK